MKYYTHTPNTRGIESSKEQRLAKGKEQRLAKDSAKKNLEKMCFRDIIKRQLKTLMCCCRTRSSYEHWLRSEVTNDASQVNTITIYVVLDHGGQYTIVLVYVIAAKLFFAIFIYRCNCTQYRLLQMFYQLIKFHYGYFVIYFNGG